MVVMDMSMKVFPERFTQAGKTHLECAGTILWAGVLDWAERTSEQSTNIHLSLGWLGYNVTSQPAATAPTALHSPTMLSVCCNCELRQPFFPSVAFVGYFLTAMKCVLFLLECVSPIKLCSGGVVLCTRTIIQNRLYVYAWTWVCARGPFRCLPQEMAILFWDWISLAGTHWLG